MRLAGRGVALQPGVVHRWSVSLIRDAEHRAGDVVASGAIERVTAAVEAASTDALAQAGLFYDALAAASDEVAAHPGDPQRRARRGALLEQVGLEQAAAFDRRLETPIRGRVSTSCACVGDVEVRPFCSTASSRSAGTAPNDESMRRIEVPEATKLVVLMRD